MHKARRKKHQIILVLLCCLLILVATGLRINSLKPTSNNFKDIKSNYAKALNMEYLNDLGDKIDISISSAHETSKNNYLLSDLEIFFKGASDKPDFNIITDKAIFHSSKKIITIQDKVSVKGENNISAELCGLKADMQAMLLTTPNKLVIVAKNNRFIANKGAMYDFQMHQAIFHGPIFTEIKDDLL